MSKNETAPLAAPERVDFSRIRSTLPIPNLIDVQRSSYERFLQMNLLPAERAQHGLHAVFTGNTGTEIVRAGFFRYRLNSGGISAIGYDFNIFHNYYPRLIYFLQAVSGKPSLGIC